MFAIFTLSSGKSVHIDPSSILAIEELANGCRIHTPSASFEVKESAKEVIELISEEDEDDDED